jgi:DNA-binding response OmpR family regulator
MALLPHTRFSCAHQHRLRLSDACPGPRLQRLRDIITNLDLTKNSKSTPRKRTSDTSRSEPNRHKPRQPKFHSDIFRLLPTQFLLLEGDKPVSLGSRALEILTVLLERPDELLSKQELMGRVWPNVFVEPANLTVHMSALRRRLRRARWQPVHHKRPRTRLQLRRVSHRRRSDQTIWQ